jgi:hypothetical protein
MTNPDNTIGDATQYISMGANAGFVYFGLDKFRIF